MFTILLLLVVTSVHARPFLVVRPAGPDDSTKHVRLFDSFHVCPTEVSSRGVTIECVVPNGAMGKVKMIVNNVTERYEGFPPYTLRGDRNGVAVPWTPPSETVSLGCSADYADAAPVIGIFSCAPKVSPSAKTEEVTDVLPSPPPSSTSMPSPSATIDYPILELRSAGVDNPAKRVVLKDGFSVCPQDVSPSGISIECIFAPGAAAIGQVEFVINEKLVRSEGLPPYTIAGDKAGFAYPWTPPLDDEVTIGCHSTGLGKASVRGKFICATPTPIRTPEETLLATSSSPIVTSEFEDTTNKNVSSSPSASMPSPSAQAKIGSPTNSMFSKVAVTGGLPPSRHESCAVMCDGKFYVIGGRNKNRGIWSFNPDTKKWAERTSPGKELHHMQCVCIGKKIYLPGAWYGGFPTENAYTTMHVFDTSTDTWTNTLPAPSGNRLRGASAVAVYDGTKIIMSAGSSGGHGAPTTLLPFTDMFDTAQPEKGWTPMADIPDPRDHAGGAVVGKYFCVAGGRIGSAPGFSFWEAANQVAPINCLDLTTGSWSRKMDLPTPRGGVSVGATCDGYVMVAGGEAIEPSGARLAYNRVDLYDPVTNTVVSPHVRMIQARHGTGLGVSDCPCGDVYIGSGSGGIGGAPELNDLEVWKSSGTPGEC